MLLLANRMTHHMNNHVDSSHDSLQVVPYLEGEYTVDDYKEDLAAKVCMWGGN